MIYTQDEKDAAFHTAMQHFDDCCNRPFCHPVAPCREGARLLLEAARICGIEMPYGVPANNQP